MPTWHDAIAELPPDTEGPERALSFQELLKNGDAGLLHDIYRHYKPADLYNRIMLENLAVIEATRPMLAKSLRTLLVQ